VGHGRVALVAAEAGIAKSPLRQAEGRQGEARELLAPIHKRFSEGLIRLICASGLLILVEYGAPFRHESDPTPLSGGE
jgi:hypothetical protein